MDVFWSLAVFPQDDVLQPAFFVVRELTQALDSEEPVAAEQCRKHPRL